jgi:hypothetical protein
MGEVFFNRIYPSMGGSRSAYPSEWIQTIRKSESLNARMYVPDHGFVDSPEILKEELVNFAVRSRRMLSITNQNSPITSDSPITDP